MLFRSILGELVHNETVLASLRARGIRFASQPATAETDTVMVTAHGASEAAKNRARARGLRIYGATLTSFEGAAYWTPEGEAKRQALNHWIRTSGAYDAVLDFAAVLEDPDRPTRMRAAYDSGDRLHPGPAGYAAMANSIDLGLFRPRAD